MIRNNKTCIICGKKYTYCSHCDAFEKQPTWMVDFHEENCMDIFYAVSNYNAEVATLEETVNKLEKLDLSNIDNFDKSIKECIEKIFAEKAKIDETKMQSNKQANVENKTEQKRTSVDEYAKNKSKPSTQR